MQMSDYTISIPDALYVKAQRVAEQTAQPVDDVIRRRLAGALDESTFDLPADERDELKAMSYLSDDALFAMMREQMQSVKQTRLSTLMDKNSRGTITDDEHDKLARLVEDGERLTLRKATAMDILMDRGHKLRLDDMKATDE
jgi:hypothetical protein